MRSSRRYLVACVAAVLVAGLMVAAIPTTASADETPIVTSPSILNLESNGGVFTIHAEIGYSKDYTVEVLVNGVELPDDPLNFYTFSDSRGELVIRCNMEDVKGNVEIGEATLDVTVEKDGLTYSFETVVISVISEGK